MTCATLQPDTSAATVAALPKADILRMEPLMPCPSRRITSEAIAAACKSKAGASWHEARRMVSNFAKLPKL